MEIGFEKGDAGLDQWQEDEPGHLLAELNDLGRDNGIGRSTWSKTALSA
jgi:argininosuccinate synthase